MPLSGDDQRRFELAELLKELKNGFSRPICHDFKKYSWPTLNWPLSV